MPHCARCVPKALRYPSWKRSEPGFGRPTAGAKAPVVSTLARMLAMQIYHRQRQLGESDGEAVLAQAGLSKAH
ncbi:hypothetical protein [Rhizobium mesoamericanum]|uniref:hypothetical protein n=1 Tax=Rhizobium mesoamericanum TaxID=1079800 RepID=UPI0027D7A532|nr:hypothetical protein [Rhizobium mesoamericanum]